MHNNERFRGAIWGQFVGDAFCLGSHWIYDLKELARTFPKGIEGFEPPREGHYHAGKVSGELTHYGDGALVFLQSVAERGAFDPVDFGTRFVALFGSDAYRGYRDHATRGTLENYRAFAAGHPGEPYSFQDGADDDQPATATRLAPMVVAHYHDGHLLDVAQSATRVCQNNARAVAYMRCHALVMRELFGGCDLRGAFLRAAAAVGSESEVGEEVRRKVRTALDALHLGVTEATLEFGQSCPLDSSFPAAVHCAVKHGEDFAGAVRATAAAGGDSAARAAMIGVWLGACLGIGAVPAEWRERLAAREEISRNVELLLQKVLGS